MSLETDDILLGSSIAKVSWTAFSSNWKTISSKLPKGTGILPMVKTNAYNHDLQIISEYCAKLGAVGVGVANIMEALELRALGYEDRIINFGRINPDILDAAVEFHIHTVVHSAEDVLLLSEYKRPITFHLEIETGMHRLGMEPEEIPLVLELLRKTSHKMEGVFTHLVESEVRGSKFLDVQIQKFESALAFIRANYQQSFITHVENSGGIFNQKRHWDWVRPGIGIYGYHPNPKARAKDLIPVLEWSAPIMQIKNLKKGDFVSYNRLFRAPKDMTIATIPVGYGDGFSRKYRPMSVGYRNRKCKILGNVCMDLTMIDITGIKNPKIGDEVILMGSGKNKEPTAWDYAKVDHTTPYEVLTRISPRVMHIKQS